MGLKQPFILLFLVICTHNLYAQEPVKADSLIKQLDSLQRKKDSLPAPDIDPSGYTKKTTLSFRTYFILLGSNIRQQFTAPFHTKGKSWLKVAGFAAATTALTFADKPVNKFVLKITDKSDAVVSTSSYLTSVSGVYEAFTLTALGTYSFIVNNQKLKTTTLLATQAYLTGAVMESFLKILSGRQRPNYYDINGNNRHIFRGPFRKGYKDADGKAINSSFPSGHATVAFAAATVFAKEYKNNPWVPAVSYTFASMIAVSRLTENKHWISDVFAGAVFGFLTGKQISNNYHRYQLIESGGLKKVRSRIGFQLDRVNGRTIPGLVYKL